MTLLKGNGAVLKSSSQWQLTLSQTTNFRLKEFADDNFQFNENGREFSKLVENTVGKGDIACHKQSLLFPQCFQKICTADMKKPGLVWERVKRILKINNSWPELFNFQNSFNCH